MKAPEIINAEAINPFSEIMMFALVAARVMISNSAR